MTKEMNEAIIAIDIHIECLKQDFEKLVVQRSGRKSVGHQDNIEIMLALDTIKAKMLDCERSKELLILIDKWQLLSE